MSDGMRVDGAAGKQMISADTQITHTLKLSDGNFCKIAITIPKGARQEDVTKLFADLKDADNIKIYEKLAKDKGMEKGITGHFQLGSSGKVIPATIFITKRPDLSSVTPQTASSRSSGAEHRADLKHTAAAKQAEVRHAFDAAGNLVAIREQPRTLEENYKEATEKQSRMNELLAGNREQNLNEICQLRKEIRGHVAEINRQMPEHITKASDNIQSIYLNVKSNFGIDEIEKQTNAVLTKDLNNSVDPIKKDLANIAKIDTKVKGSGFFGFGKIADSKKLLEVQKRLEDNASSIHQVRINADAAGIKLSPSVEKELTRLLTENREKMNEIRKQSENLNPKDLVGGRGTNIQEDILFENTYRDSNLKLKDYGKTVNAAAARVASDLRPVLEAQIAKASLQRGTPEGRESSEKLSKTLNKLLTSSQPSHKRVFNELLNNASFRNLLNDHLDKNPAHAFSLKLAILQNNVNQLQDLAKSKSSDDQLKAYKLYNENVAALENLEKFSKDNNIALDNATKSQIENLRTTNNNLGIKMT